MSSILNNALLGVQPGPSTLTSGIVGTTLVVFLMFSTYLFCRTEKVHKFRVNMIWEDYDTFNKLPGFDYMILHFWVWPLNRFIPPNAEEAINKTAE